MTTTETTLLGVGGVQLHLRAHRPPGSARGIVVLSHGLGEHCARYDHVAEALVAEGLAFQGYDHRGHGRSTGLRGHVDGFEQYTADLLTVVEAARSEHGPELPVFVYGHSMGGLIVLSFLLDHPGAGIAGFVVSNPLIRTAFQPPRVKVIAGRLLSRLVPRLRMPNEVDSKGISRDPAVVAAYDNDPYVHGLVSTRWFTSMTAAVARAEAEVSKVSVPGLWLLSGADPIVDSRAALGLARTVRASEVREYPDAVHEPHNDLEKDAVISDLVSWISGRLPTT